MSVIAFAVVTIGPSAVCLWLVAALHLDPWPLPLTSQQLEIKNVQCFDWLVMAAEVGGASLRTEFLIRVSHLDFA